MKQLPIILQYRQNWGDCEGEGGKNVSSLSPVLLSPVRHSAYPSAVMGILLKLKDLLAMSDSMTSLSVATSSGSTLSQTVMTVPSAPSECSRILPSPDFSSARISRLSRSSMSSSLLADIPLYVRVSQYFLLSE